MKLIRLTSTFVAAAAMAFACGCSAPSATAGLAPRTAHAGAPADPNVTGTTSLMSAQMAGPAPKVGKAHLAADDESEAASTSTNVTDDATEAPKTARRSDGSRRGGGFGSTK